MTKSKQGFKRADGEFQGVDPVCARDVRLNAVLHLDDEVLASFEGEGSSGAIAFRIGPASIRSSTIEVLERWRRDATPLATFVSMEHELVGLVHEATGRAIAGVLIADEE